MGILNLKEPPHFLDVKEFLNIAKTDVEKGLSQEEAEKRLKLFGKNKLEESRKVTWFEILIGQFLNPMSYLLAFAALISLFLREYLDAVAILVVIIVNAVIGFYMEYKAERTLTALKNMITPQTKVLRDGILTRLPVIEIVPGDVLILEAGDVIPAEARIVSCNNLEVNESILTGESLPVKKYPDPLPKDTPLPDRKNILFTGTHITRGNCVAVVFATAMDTELGRISKLLQETESPKTPIEKRLEQLSHVLIKLVIAIALITTIAGWLRGHSFLKMLEVGIALAVAAVPEGLPIVATITLAVGVYRMAKKNALIRNLASVETLGSATVVCTDKTGTITQNRMKVTDSFFLCKEAQKKALEVAVLCNNAQLTDKDGIGDPMEIALLLWAKDSGVDIKALRESHPRLNEEPFDSSTMKMLTYHRDIIAIKGAPEKLISECEFVFSESGVVPFDKSLEELFQKKLFEFANLGARTLAFAFIETGLNSNSVMVFLGVVAISDPPRPETKDAVSKCKDAGVKVIMVTGDHALTATAIAKEVGISQDNDAFAIEGKNIDGLSDEKLYELLLKNRVAARVLPEHKLRIVKVLQQKREVVGMTGDGVNDAVALKQADIGIAMGITGTEVTKEAADMILQDDRFATIADAIEEGRVIFDNIKKAVLFLLSCNVSEVVTVFVSVVSGLGMLLLPLQILWINLITDVIPALALSVDPPEKDVMKRPPRDPEEEILTKESYKKISFYGTLMSVVAISAWLWARYVDILSIKSCVSIVFHTLVFSQLFHALNLRGVSVFKDPMELFSNKVLFIGVLGSMFLQYLTTKIPILVKVLNTSPLGVEEWTAIVMFSLVPFVLGNILKLFYKD